MKTAKDFEEVRISLCNQVNKEIAELKEYFSGIDIDEIKTDPEKTGEACEKIVYASEGLKKLSCVLGFVDCWEENGDIPQLSRTASFSSKE